MENDLELEDRILTMLSTQYEGIYQIDIDNDSVLCIYNRGNKFKKDGNVELEQWVQRMVDRCHYEDRGRLLDLISVEAVKGFGSNDEFKKKLDVRLMYDGKYKWILVTLMYDKTFNQITVTERDVSHRYEYYEIIKRKNAELRKLLQTTEQYKDALMSESIVMYQVNFSKDTIENGIYQRKNNKMYSALDTVGISTSSSYDEYCRRWQKRVSKDTIEDYLKLATSKKIIELFNNGNTIVSIDYRTMDTQDTEMWIDKSIYLSKDKLTDDILGIISLRNVTERYRQEYLKQRLEKQASLDLLTGLYNHVTGELLIKSRIDNSAHMYSAFVIFDIDSFKLVNDTYGHQIGDEVLKISAQILHKLFPNDTITRLGGDEFLVLKYGIISKQELIEQGNNLIIALQEQFKKSRYYYNLSASVGISYTTDNQKIVDELIKESDTALYEAKQTGRSKCCIFHK